METSLTVKTKVDDMTAAADAKVIAFNSEEVAGTRTSSAKDSSRFSEIDGQRIFGALDKDKIKDQIKAQACKPVYDVANFYYKKGIWQMVARHHTFEHVTLSIIAINALWIWIDTDYNHAAALLDAEPIFQIAEQAFCLYFALEWFIRYMSFRRKRDGLKDGWFVFDSTLVFMMVVETWVMTTILLIVGGEGLSGGGLLRLARLLRLSRMARMARLFRAMPELLILIKAMASSLRSCAFVGMLMLLFLYVFGIMFRQVIDGSKNEDLRDKFITVPKSMYTLWIDGSILDSPGQLTVELWDEHPVYAFLFWVFAFLSALTVMNMLIGVLCEVVSAVAATEREQMTVSYVKEKLHQIMKTSGLDADGDGSISKKELSGLLDIPEACKILDEVGVDPCMLVDNIDYLFGPEEEGEEEEEETVLTFEDFMELLLDLRGSNTATVKDMVNLRKFITASNAKFRQEFKFTEKCIQETDNSIRCLQTAMSGSVAASSIPSSMNAMNNAQPGRVISGKTVSLIDDEVQVLPMTPDCDGREGTGSNPRQTDVQFWICPQPKEGNGNANDNNGQLSNGNLPHEAALSLRQELDRLVRESLLPEMLKVNSQVQRECYMEMRNLGAQVKGDLEKFEKFLTAQERRRKHWKKTKSPPDDSSDVEPGLLPPGSVPGTFEDDSSAASTSDGAERALDSSGRPLGNSGGGKKKPKRRQSGMSPAAVAPANDGAVDEEKVFSSPSGPRTVAPVNPKEPVPMLPGNWITPGRIDVAELPRGASSDGIGRTPASLISSAGSRNQVNGNGDGSSRARHHLAEGGLSPRANADPAYGMPMPNAGVRPDYRASASLS